MAIKWGPAITSGQNGMRLGYELSFTPSKPTTNTTSVTVTLRLYLGTRRSVYDSSNSWAISGDFSGSGAANINHSSATSWSNSNVTRIATRTHTESLSYTGTKTVSFSASMSGINAAPGTARVSGSISIPRRPINNPLDPTGLTVTRNGETSHSLHWSNTSATSASRPYSQIHIQRWDTVGRQYKTIATVSTRTSYTDRTTTANQRYRYRIRARNSAGYSGYDYSAYIATTPAAPSNVRGRKTSGGDITVTWSLSGINYHTGIEIWAIANGVNQSTRLGLRASGQTSFTHANPDPTKTWAYRVRVLAENRTSSFSANSNTIQLLTNPLAPTELSPTSVVRDGAEDITFTWQHNEVDGTDQRKFQIAHRPQGGPAGDTWTYEPEIQSDISEFVLPADTYENGQVIEWRVRTWGMFDGTGTGGNGASPFSVSGIVTLSTKPFATITSPESGDVIGASSVGVHWEFFDPEGDVQSRWRANLLDANGETLETRTGGRDEWDTVFQTVIEDGGTYSISVEVQDTTGLWSDPDVVDISVTYPSPPMPEITTRWDIETGSVVVEITNPPEDETQVEAAYNNLWRSIDGGPWTLVGSRIPINTAVTDYIPGLGVSNHYRVTAVSEMPSEMDSPVTSVDTHDTHYWAWINAGPGFINSVRVRDNLDIQETSGREKELRRFAGRTKAVEFVGEQRTRTISLSARLAPESSTQQDIEYLADFPAPACLRTPDGTRYFVSMGEPSVAKRGMTVELSWTFEEIDHREAERHVEELEI